MQSYQLFFFFQLSMIFNIWDVKIFQFFLNISGKDLHNYKDKINQEIFTKTYDALERSLTYLIHSPKDYRSNIVPILGFEPRSSHTLGGWVA